MVRIGTPGDVHEVMRLALAGSSENGFLEPNPEKMLADVWAALNKDRGLMGVIGPEGHLEGAVLLRVGKMWYSEQDVLEEKAIFVDLDARKKSPSRAKALTTFSKHVADGLGLPLIIGVLSNIRTEAKVALYKRQFGEPAGAFFLYGAKTGEWRAKVEA